MSVSAAQRVVRFWFPEGWEVWVHSVVCIVFVLFLSFLVLIVSLLFNNLLVWSYVGAGEFQNMWSTAIQEKPLLGGLKCV